MTELKVITRNLIEEAKEKLENFKGFVETVRGSQDVEKRARVVLGDRNPETSTNLTTNQVDYIVISTTIATYFPEMEPLRILAEKHLLVSKSKDGWGVEKMIQHEQAIAEKRLMQLGLKSQPTGEKEKDVE